MQRPLSERALIFIVGTIQFINIVEFMMVMPLGPDIALALGIATSNVGWIGASYTVAAAGSALLAVAFLDRFDRRSAVMFFMLGLAAGTVAAALATDMTTLIAARFLAGIFGGPATSVAMAMIIDGVAPERRGRALGAVMSAFAIASVLGVPLALELAHWGDWRTPFYAVALLGTAVAIAIRWYLPSIRSHVLARQQRPDWEFLTLFTRRKTLLAYSATGFALFGGFLVIPNLSAYVQFNLGYAREYLGWLYLVGGCASFVVMRVAGHYVDHYGSVPVAWAGTGLLITCLGLGFVWLPLNLPVMLIFISFMMAMSMRNVAAVTLLTHVPDAHERAGFMSANSAMQNFGAAAGAAVSSQLLQAEPNGELIGMSGVAGIAMLCALGLPFQLRYLQRLTQIKT